ncbi:MAG: winged helix-turn-helix transcriptional regulator, partial [Acidobacteriota bacterium]|nr:winged helix-turn-helix transcriptional regulator [Acidobacteriota bacterium]
MSELYLYSQVVNLLWSNQSLESQSLLQTHLSLRDAMPAKSTPASYHIGSFELEISSGDLRSENRHIRLQEMPRKLLIALAERPGQVLSRAELCERLWPANTFVDFEDGLNTAMRKLREALKDDPQSPQYIETVRGRGYRLVAAV